MGGENLSRPAAICVYPRQLIYETSIHFIDTFRYLFGEVRHVDPHVKRLNPVIRGEDAAQVTKLT